MNTDEVLTALADIDAHLVDIVIDEWSDGDLVYGNRSLTRDLNEVRSALATIVERVNRVAERA